MSEKSDSNNGLLEFFNAACVSRHLVVMNGSHDMVADDLHQCVCVCVHAFVQDFCAGENHN